MHLVGVMLLMSSSLDSATKKKQGAILCQFAAAALLLSSLAMCWQSDMSSQRVSTYTLSYSAHLAFIAKRYIFWPGLFM